MITSRNIDMNSTELPSALVLSSLTVGIRQLSSEHCSTGYPSSTSVRDRFNWIWVTNVTDLRLEEHFKFSFNSCSQHDETRSLKWRKKGKRQMFGSGHYASVMFMTTEGIITGCIDVEVQSWDHCIHVWNEIPIHTKISIKQLLINVWNFSPRGNSWSTHAARVLHEFAQMELYQGENQNLLVILHHYGCCFQKLIRFIKVMSF